MRPCHLSVNLKLSVHTFTFSSSLLPLSKYTRNLCRQKNGNATVQINIKQSFRSEITVQWQVITTQGPMADHRTRNSESENRN